MIKNLYSSAASLNVLSRQHENTSKNLANVNTPGHRRAVFSVEAGELDAVRHGPIGAGPQVGETRLDFSTGHLANTGRPLDLAISNDAFFVLQAENGEQFTKDGRFFRDPISSELVNHEGIQVMGEGGPIKIGFEFSDREIQVSESGEVLAKGNRLGQLKLVGFEDNQALTAIGQTRFSANEETILKVVEPRVMQGSLEMSNANPVLELVNLIVGSRQYEAVQKSVSAVSDAMREHIRS